MTKVRDPLFSRKASGRFARDLVYASWRGIPYVRLFQKSNQPDTPRQRAVNVHFGNVSQRWAGLSEEQREAWRRLASKWPTPTSAHCLFISSATLALDAGLPEPVFPPRPKKVPVPRVSVSLGPEPDSVLVSWPRLIEAQRRSRPIGTPHASRLTGFLDLWLCQSRPSWKPVLDRFRHLAYVPLETSSFLIRGLKPNSKCSLRARLILPDTNHGHFGSAELILPPKSA
jgi:hypothetical protein